MPVTGAQVEAGAIALFANNNTDDNIEMVKQKWPDYPDGEKNVYRVFARVVLEAAPGGAGYSRAWFGQATS